MTSSSPSPKAIDAADAVVEIRQFGSAPIVNAFAAVAVAMHVWIAQHAAFSD